MLYRPDCTGLRGVQTGILPPAVGLVTGEEFGLCLEGAEGGGGGGGEGGGGGGGGGGGDCKRSCPALSFLLGLSCACNHNVSLHMLVTAFQGLKMHTSSKLLHLCVACIALTTCWVDKACACLQCRHCRS